MVRVSHAARDGQADTDRVEIISNADKARVLVDISTEYKGIPTLFVGDQPAGGSGVSLTTLDFGNVRAGVRESRVIYLKNRDNIVDGSVLGVTELRTDPQSSSNFIVAANRGIPAFVNQFNTLCATTANCASNMGDVCETTLGVCSEGAGKLRDIITATVTYVGSTPGMLEEAVVILSNDSGTAGTTRRIAIRANVVFSSLEITPDPVNIQAYVGYPASQTVTMRNAGTAPLVLQALNLAPMGAIVLDTTGLALPVTLMPNQSQTVGVVFTPLTVGTSSAALIVTSDDADMPMQTVRINGTAENAPILNLSVSRIDFGDVHQGVSVPFQVTARNDGG